MKIVYNKIQYCVICGLVVKMKHTMTTLCYIEKDDAYLMLHRVKKEQDANKDKWIGLGGHFEAMESPEECVVREVFEESGLTLTDYRLRGIVTFVSDIYETEYMYLFTATGFSGDIRECNEGILEWVPKEKISSLPVWEGDKIFFSLLAERADFFSLKLCYEGERLASAFLDGKPFYDSRQPSPS